MNKLAIIGGSGLYRIEDLDVTNTHDINTPFGTPSAPIIEGKFKDSDPLLFLPRHGLGHALLPSEVNYRANIWALKKLGARRIIGFSAVGSLREKIKPADMAIIGQYIDFTKGKREASFFGNGVIGHISTAKPVCPALSGDIKKAAQECGLEMHEKTVYVCVEGPRLGTQAESHMFRAMNADVVGMTNVPEAFLAREAQMAYCTIGIVTDYDCWLEDESKHARADEMVALYMANIEKVKTLLKALAHMTLNDTPDWVTSHLQYAIVTPPETISEENKEWLSVLQI